MLQNVTVVARTIILAACVGLAGWWTMFIRDQLSGHRRELEARDEQIEDLTQTVSDREREITDLNATIVERDQEIARLGVELAVAQEKIEELELAMWLLKVNHRVARVEVLEQVPDTADPTRFVTRVRFVELGTEGEEVGPAREIEIQGKMLYVEGLVIKFDDNYVEAGDALRGTSVAIFRRVFSEHQPPNEGVAIDLPRTHPLPHRDDDFPDPFYEDLWERFWDYANDPALAATRGVRAMHGEAPSIELRPGKSYRVELRASGGLTIVPE